MYSSRECWIWYEQAMERHRLAADRHDRALALADAHTCLDWWFRAVERELLVEAAA